MASRARTKNHGVVGKLYRSTGYALVLSPLLAPGDGGESLPVMDFSKKGKKPAARKPAAIVPSNNDRIRRTRQPTPAVQDPPLAKRSQPALPGRPPGRTTRSNTPAIADPLPVKTLHSASAAAVKSARTLRAAGTVLEQLEEEHEDPTPDVGRNNARLNARTDNLDFPANMETSTYRPSAGLGRNQTPVIPPTPLPRSGAYKTLFDEEALLEAEAAELEDDPYANEPEDDSYGDEPEEPLVGFGQPLIRSPFRRPSNPPSTQASSDDEGQSRQARRDAKGKGRAIVYDDDLDDDELEDQLEELEDDEPDEPSNAPGEKSAH